MDGWTDGWMGGWKDERTGGRMEGRMDRYLSLSYVQQVRDLLQAVVPNDQRYRRLGSNSVSEQITRHNPAVTATPEGLLEENLCGTQWHTKALISVHRLDKCVQLSEQSLVQTACCTNNTRMNCRTIRATTTAPADVALICSLLCLLYGPG